VRHNRDRRHAMSSMFSGPHLFHGTAAPQALGYAAVIGRVCRVVPAGMAKLHRDPYPPWKRPQEIGQPGVVPWLRGRELDQQDSPFAGQLMPAGCYALRPCLG
jgi:hypothetical protein